MGFWLRWKRDDGTQGVRLYDSLEAAADAARDVAGIAVISRDPAGSLQVFRDGRFLDGPDEMQAVAELVPRRQIEILVTRAEEPEHNVDPEDTTGSGWRPGSPAVFGWQLAEYIGIGPQERLHIRRGPEGTFPTSEAAEAAAREAVAEDPELVNLPIVHIHSA